jgi:4-amino-4-deoxy-L-arabinose transferase-like glycosyltransferase
LTWIILAGCLGLMAFEVFIDLNRPDVVDRREARAIAISAETWRHKRTLETEQMDVEAWLPRLRGEVVLQEAPGLSWLHMLAIELFGDEQLSSEEVIYQARVVSAVMGLVTVAAVFWAGMSIGGWVTATLAALICLSCPLLVQQSRLAVADVPGLAWAILSLAAALWATRPLRPVASLTRQALGWTLCGLGLGLALLTLGPAALPLVVGPLLMILLLCPHRIGHLMGLVASILIAALMIMPWLAYVQQHDGQIWRQWLGEVQPLGWSDPARLGRLGGERLVAIAAAVVPWTLWLIGGLLQPFSTSSQGSRQRMFVGWVWFITVGMLLLLSPEDGHNMSMIAAIPAGAVLMGQLFRQWADLSAEGRHARLWRILRWPQVVLVVAGSALVPAALYGQPLLLERGWLSDPVLANSSVVFATGLGVVLLALALLGLRAAMKGYPAKALVCWALWVACATAVVMIPLSRGPVGRSAIKGEGQLLGHLIGVAPAYAMAGAAGEVDAGEAGIDPVILLYAQQALPTASAAQLERALDEGVQVYAVTKGQASLSARWVRRYAFERSGLRLWSSHHGDAPAGTMPVEAGPAEQAAEQASQGLMQLGDTTDLPDARPEEAPTP